MPTCIGDSNDFTNTVNQIFVARSHHPGGVNASLCDASVRFVSNTINLATWRALTTANGGEIIPGDY